MGLRRDPRSAPPGPPRLLIQTSSPFEPAEQRARGAGGARGRGIAGHVWVPGMCKIDPSRHYCCIAGAPYFPVFHNSCAKDRRLARMRLVDLGASSVDNTFTRFGSNLETFSLALVRAQKPRLTRQLVTQRHEISASRRKRQRLWIDRPRHLRTGRYSG